MIPARVALALQADGWWLRSDVIWAKPNPMPESVTDRPTSAHEHVFLLAKSPRYYFDADAVKESAEARPQQRLTAPHEHPKAKLYGGSNFVDGGISSSRNARNVWTIATAPYAEAHFATFPPELAERCIKAGTSERGCCAKCGAPWVRVVDVESRPNWIGGEGQKHDGTHYRPNIGGGVGNDAQARVDRGWAPSCGCPAAAPVPCVVLDPFAGAGTALLVADRLQRDAIGIELNPAYSAMATNRLRDDAGMFAEVAAE